MSRTPSPCGTKTARRRHKTKNETCTTCGPTQPPTPKQPCGTPAAFRRHRKKGETPCRPCTDAIHAYDAQRRRAQGSPQRNTIPTKDFIEEVIFLNNAGEGRHRILTATGYEGREQAFRDRLYTNGHNHLANQILNPWDLAA